MKFKCSIDSLNIAFASDVLAPLLINLDTALNIASLSKPNVQESNIIPANK